MMIPDNISKIERIIVNPFIIYASKPNYQPNYNNICISYMQILV